MEDPDAIVAFWRDAGPARWFAGDDAFDAEVAARWSDAHHAAARRELDGWGDTATGALALVLLLDQFPRNIFRRSAHAYATDPLGRLHADLALARGHDRATERALRPFLYLPFEHSEDVADQERAVALVAALGDEQALDWALRHRDAVRRFGRFPGRNAALGRATTPEEQAWLDAGGGGFSG